MWSPPISTLFPYTTLFRSLLTEQSISAIADVRRFPGSRRYPHFNQAALSTALAEAGIEYHHFPDLDRKSTRLNSSHTVISYAVFYLKKKTTNIKTDTDSRT